MGRPAGQRVSLDERSVVCHGRMAIEQQNSRGHSGHRACSKDSHAVSIQKTSGRAVFGRRLLNVRVSTCGCKNFFRYASTARQKQGQYPSPAELFIGGGSPSS